MADYMALEETLKCLVNKRLSAAAAAEILGIVGRMRTEFEDQALHSKQEIDRQRRLLDMVLKPDVKLHRADFHPVLKTEQGWSSSLVQEEPEPPQIKDGQEELLTLPSVRREDDAENRDSEAEPLDVTPTKHLKTPPYVEGCGVSPPSSSGLFLSPHLSGSDTEGSDEHEENMEDKSDLNTLNKTHTRHLRTHMRSHTRGNSHTFIVKPFHCTVCGNGFANMVTLNRHMTIHTGEKPFSCTVCGQNFRRRSYLTQHASTHTLTGEKPFGCSDCSKSFGKIEYLNKHMRIHTGVKSYSCAVCGKCFRNNTHLKTHMRTHTGEKPFSCSDCGKGFSQTSSLKTHMRIHFSEKVIT